MPNPKVKLVLLALLSPILVAAQPPSPRDALALALDERGELPQAAPAWKIVTVRDASDAAAFANVGAVLSQKQKRQGAASAYRKALARNLILPVVELDLG